jgi:hypothetical protein
MPPAPARLCYPGLRLAAFARILAPRGFRQYPAERGRSVWIGFLRCAPWQPTGCRHGFTGRAGRGNPDACRPAAR